MPHAWSKPEDQCSSPGAWGGELVEAAGGGEDDERDLGVAQHGQLVGLLEQPAPALGEAHLPARPVLDPPQLHPPALPLLLLRRRRPSRRLPLHCSSLFPPPETAAPPTKSLAMSSIAQSLPLLCGSGGKAGRNHKRIGTNSR